ncbi:MAG: hypothetical protein K8H88_21215, partial [Sandaracinaceae bacterium]|nr:hypothetical protein [Sandaracinaceae bacterium]
MSRKHIDEDHLTITGAHRRSQPPGISVEDDVVIIVTQAFDSHGHNLVGLSDVTFDGHPAVTLKLRVGEREGLVHLSPIHGDKRKSGFTDIEAGTRCAVFCPVCDAPLAKVGEVDDGSGADYYALYLTPKLDKGAMVAISDIWGHYHSRIVDD